MERRIACRIACRIAGACVLAMACGPAVQGSGTEEAGGSSGEVEVVTTGGADSSSSTGEPPLQGPGCGEPPPCDRGTYEGHARIESAADLARFEGYTEVTGMLEIMHSEDLVCLDGLACL